MDFLDDWKVFTSTISLLAIEKIVVQPRIVYQLIILLKNLGPPFFYCMGTDLRANHAIVAGKLLLMIDYIVNVAETIFSHKISFSTQSSTTGVTRPCILILFVYLRINEDLIMNNK